MKAKNNNKGNVPNLRFPEFEGEWEKKKLGEILEFKNGINASKEQYGKGVKFINVLDILENDFITYEKIIGLVDVSKEVADKYSVNYGDILFQRSSETREEVGTANVYLDKKYTATFGGFVIRGKKIGEYEPVFLNKLLKTNAVRDCITSKSGGSTRYNVGQEILSSVEVSLPSLSEQKKIADFLLLIDDRIQTQREIIEHYESLIQNLRNNFFLQKIRFEEFACSWEEKTLGKIATFYSGGTPLTTKREFFDGDIPFIRSGEINADKTEQFISESGLKNSSAKMVDVGDVLYALYGATSGEVGISKIKGAINQAVLCIKSPENHYFLYSYLLNKKECITKTYLQGGQGNLSAEIVKQIKIPIPSTEEQNRIASFLSQIDQKIQIEKTILEQLEKQKKYLLQQMFI